MIQNTEGALARGDVAVILAGMKDALQVQRNRAARLRAERQAFRKMPKPTAAIGSSLAVVPPVLSATEVSKAQAGTANKSNG